MALEQEDSTRHRGPTLCGVGWVTGAYCDIGTGLPRAGAGGGQ